MKVISARYRILWETTWPVFATGRKEPGCL